MAGRGRALRIGVISDTHGLVRPEALRALRGVEIVVHAGDIGTPDVLEALRALAPVVAVRGNNDRGAWARALPERVTREMNGQRVHVLHDVSELSLDPVTAGVAVVIAGHSHRPSMAERDGVLFLNPGSAGPRRFTLPISLATLTLGGGRPRARLITLEAPAGPRGRWR
jgi:putative phosphoesterase